MDEYSPLVETCPNCKSDCVELDEEFVIYKCKVCGTTWTYDDPDPDYDEIY